MALSSSQTDPIGGLLTDPIEQDPFAPGPLTGPVLAASDGLFTPSGDQNPLQLQAAASSGAAVNWEAIDATIASLNGQAGSEVFQGESNLDLADYSTLVDLDQLTGLLVTDEPANLAGGLQETNLSPLIGDAFSNDQLLVRKSPGDIDLLAGVEALILSSANDQILLQHGQPDSLWIDGGPGIDSALVVATQAPLLDQWRNVEQLSWQAVDGAGLDQTAPSLLGADHHFTLREDQAFSLVLADLFPLDGQISSLELVPLGESTPANWLQLEQRRPDDSLAERLLIETLLRDGQGNLLSSEEIAALAPGSLIQADLVVSDKRADGKGLIGLELNLQWDPATLSLQSIQVDPSLPLFRSTGSLDAADGLLTGLAGAALPSSGTGSVLGDERRDLFASLTFSTGSIGTEGLNLQITPTKLPTSKNLPLSPAEVVAVGSDPALMPVIYGLASQTEVGEHQFLVEGLYADGRRWQQELTLTIQNVNDAPVTVPAPPLTVQEEEPLQIDLSSFFGDEDLALGDQLSYHLVGVSPEWLQLDSVTGLLNGQPDDRQVGTWNLEIEARDRSGASARQTIALSIQNVNDVPEWSGEELPEILLREQRNFQITLPAGLFSDPDSGDSLRYSLNLQEQPELATWLSIDPITAVISGIAPQASEQPIHLKLVVSDLAGASRSIDLALKVADQTANRTPEWVGLPLENRSIQEGDRISYDLAKLFRDADTLIGDQLRFEVDAPAWLNFDTRTGQLSGQADNNAVGTVPICFRAIDLDGAEAVMRFWLTVENVNQAPERLAPAQQSRLLQSDTSFQLDLDTIFRDADTIHGDWLTYTLQVRSTSNLGVPDWLDWNPSTGALTLNPGVDDRGLLSLRFDATDLSGLSSSYQLNLGIVAEGGLVEVNQALQPLNLKPGEASVLDIADAFRLLRGSTSVEYSFELLRRSSDGSLSSMEEADGNWVTLVDRREQPVQRQDRITIEPVLRLIDSGELISSDELAKLQAGTGIQLSIAVEDLRTTSTLPGLIGLDLGLKWSGLQLDISNPPDLRQAISQLMPLFRQVDLDGLKQQSLRFSAASLPAMGLGQALGDDPGESFLTLNFLVTDPSQPVRFDLTLNDESSGGLGLGLADGSSGETVLNLIDLSTTPLPELHLDPSQEDLGNYALRVIATSLAGDAVSQLLALKVSSGENRAPELVRSPKSLAFTDNRTQILPLNMLFSDPDGDPLSYSLHFEAASLDAQRLLENAIQLVASDSGPTIRFEIPGITAPVQGILTITGSDGDLATSHTVNLLLNPRTQTVPLFSRPLYPKANTAEQIGLGDLFGAPALQFLDSADNTDLLVRSDQPLTISLSDEYLKLANLNLIEPFGLENTWTPTGTGQSLWRIPVSKLARQLGDSPGSFDLNWLEILSPSQPNSTLKIELATSSHVSNDDDGSRYGISDSAWQQALLITMTTGEAPVVNPGTERFLRRLLSNTGTNSSSLQQIANQAYMSQSQGLLAWRTKSDFDAGLDGTLADSRSIVGIRVLSIADLLGMDTPEMADSLYQLMDLRVISKDDPAFADMPNHVEIPEGSQIQYPWDPIRFSIGTQFDPDGLSDVDPTRAGTQIIIELDLSQVGLKEGDFNGYSKFVSPETLTAATEQGLVLRDLDGNEITSAGWYDFMQRHDANGAPVGDGANFVIETINGERRLTRIQLTITDNAFGDNNLSLGVIDDPGMPTKVVGPERISQPLMPLLPANRFNTSLPVDNQEDQSIDPASINPQEPAAPQPSANTTDHPETDRPETVSFASRGNRSNSSGAGGGGAADEASGANLNSLDSGAELGSGPARPIEPQLSGAPAAGRGGDSDQALIGNGSTASSTRGSHDDTPSPDAETSGAAPLEQRGLHGGPRGGADLPAALQNLFNQLVSMVGDESALVGLMLGMMVVPGGVERGLRSLLFDSRLGEGIQVQRRNLDLEAQWPVRLIQANGQPLPLELRLQNGRLQLLAATTDAEAAPTVDEPTSNGDQGGALWLLLGELNRPGEVIEQVQRRLEQLLNGNAEGVQITWTHWLDQLSAQREERGNPSSQATLNQLRENVAMAQQIDPGMADALMAMELLDCHVRLGGQLPWLTAAEPALQA